MVAGNLAGACEGRGVGSKVRDFCGRWFCRSYAYQQAAKYGERSFVH